MVKIGSHDNWWTPDDLVQKIRDYLGYDFFIDVAADDRNKKAENYFTIEDNALTRIWGLVRIDAMGYRQITVGTVWCNPPNSKLRDFVLWALFQWMVMGMEINLLIPIDVRTRKYFAPINELSKRDDRIEMIELYQRPAFLEDGEKPKWSSRNGYMLCRFKGFNNNFDSRPDLRRESECIPIC